MSLPVWTSGNYYPRCSTLFYTGMSGISISGMPSKYRVAQLSDISCTSAFDRRGTAISTSGIGGGLIPTGHPQSVISSLEGQSVTITTASAMVKMGIMVGSTSYPPDSFGGSITLAISGSGAWLVVPQKTPIGSSTYGQFEGGSVQSSSSITLSGQYLNTTGAIYQQFAIIPLKVNPLVTFDPNGGYLDISERTRYVPLNSALGPLPTPTRTGYNFIGWFTSESGGTQVDETTVLTQDNNVTYYAHWVRSKVYVMLDATGGYCDPAILEVSVGREYSSLPTPQKNESTFDGWYTAASGGSLVTNSTIVTNTQDHTLYAHWTALSVQHTLYFNANGGEVSESSRLVYSGAAYGTLPTPTWAYHTFVGWFTEPYGGAQVSAETTMGGDDATIYAHWTDDTTTVTFNGNGGEPSTQTITYPSGSKYGSLPSASRNGYILAGWFTAATGGTRVEPGDVVSAQPLYAQWQTSGGTAEGVIWNKDTDFVIEMSA